MSRPMPDWQTVYNQADVTRMPWFHPELDPDIEHQLVGLMPDGLRLLDIGAGSGNQAALLQQRGFEVTGVDISAEAMRSAQARYPRVTFCHDDILSSRLTGPFDRILDRGCFHVFSPEQRPVYVATIERLLAPQGQLWLKCFSVDTPGNTGPYRFTADELTATFVPRFKLLSLKPTEYQGQLETNPKAWFAVFTR